MNGRLYKLFINDCKDRLVGLKGPMAVGEYQMMYVELLSQEANKKRRNLIATGLVTRCSSVYTAMQNRLVGKCTELYDSLKFVQCTNLCFFQKRHV